MNILFLEIEKVILIPNRFVAGDFATVDINGIKYTYDKKSIGYINELIEKLDLYLVLTSRSQSKLDYDSIIYQLKEIGVDSNRCVAHLSSKEDMSKTQMIERWYNNQKATFENYFIIDNMENIPVSNMKNIHLVMNGFNSTEYEKCLRSFSYVLSQKEKEVKEGFENVLSKQDIPEDLIEEISKVQTQAQEINSQTTKAVYMVENHLESLKSMFHEESRYGRRNSITNFLKKKFPLAEVNKIEAALTKKGIIPPTYLTVASLFLSTSISAGMFLYSSLIMASLAVLLFSFIILDSLFYFIFKK